MTKTPAPNEPTPIALKREERRLAQLRSAAKPNDDPKNAA